MLSSSITPCKNRSVSAHLGLVANVLRGYGLPYRQILEPQQGYRNRSFGVELDTGEFVNFILYKEELGILDVIRSAHRVSDYAAAQGLPCRQARGPIARLTTRSGRTRYGALYNYLPGHTIPWEAYTKDHLKLLGKAMSDLHAALLPLGCGDLPDAREVYAAIVGRMEHYFQDRGVRLAMRRKLRLTLPPDQFKRHCRTLDVCAALPGRQALHMDFVRGNVLFQDTPGARQDEFKVAISGILDFEKTAFGHPLFDIARTLAFLLVDCKYKSAAKVRKYFLYSGYAKRGGAPWPRQPQLLEALLDVFLLYDFYKFLRHNPYEALPNNNHFVRTKQLLAQRGLLQLSR